MLLVALAMVTPVQAAETGTSIDIEVQENGDADVKIENTVGFSGKSERQAFASISNNSTKVRKLASSTASRFRKFLNRASDQVDRNMTIEDVTASTGTKGDLGVLIVKFTWTNFAQDTTADKVTVGDVFEGGFSLEEDQSLLLGGPYPEVSTNSENGTVSGSTVEWKGPATVNENLTVTYMTQDASDSGTEKGNGSESGGDSGSGSGGNGQPGMSIVAMFVALAAVALISYRKR
ncbi:MAG: hypothetical protein ABEK59_12930 [Halobacteria archaeon]